MLVNKRLTLSTFTVFFGAWLLVSCEGNSKTFINTVEASKYGTVGIRLLAGGTQEVVEVGQAVTFTVRAYDESNLERPIDNKKIEWSVHCDTSGCGAINHQSGELSTYGRGEARVTADYGGFKASAVITISEAVLTRIVVSRVTDSPMDFCRNYAVKAVGVYQDTAGVEDERDITGLAVWRIAQKDSGQASVVKAADGSVLVSVRGEGDIQLDAVHSSRGSSQVGSYTLKATGERPALTLSPEGAVRVFSGQTRQFVAMGSWPDGSDEVTQQVSWRSDDPALLGFLGDTSSTAAEKRQDGLATGKAEGETQVYASCGSEEASQAVNIVALKVAGIRVFRVGDEVDSDAADQPYKMVLGNVTRFRAEAVFSGNEQPENPVDVTFDCEWSRTGGDIVSISVGNLNDPSGRQGLRRGDVTAEMETDTLQGYVEVKARYIKKKYQDSYPEKTFQVFVPRS